MPRGVGAGEKTEVDDKEEGAEEVKE